MAADSCIPLLCDVLHEGSLLELLLLAGMHHVLIDEQVVVLGEQHAEPGPSRNGSSAEPSCALYLGPASTTLAGHDSAFSRTASAKR